MRHCRVIGGTGFIGTHLVKVLVSRKRKVTVIGRKPAPSTKLADGIRYIAGDYGDRNILERALKDVEEVILLAYCTVPKTSYDDPVKDILYNLPPTVTLLETAYSKDIEKMVIVSSGGTVYGKAHKMPIPEDHPTNPISPYGITKLAVEKYAMMFNVLKGLPVVCVRPSNAYGEGQVPFTGQGFIATAIKSILNRQEIILFGETGSVRDYIHVTDVVKGIVAALESSTSSSCYNIGSGVGKTNKEVLDTIYPFAKSAGYELRLKTMPFRQFDVPINILDKSKLTKETGWIDTVPFEIGIERTWNWFYHKNKL